jgi:hypothetical protein
MQRASRHRLALAEERPCPVVEGTAVGTAEEERHTGQGKVVGKLIVSALLDWLFGGNVRGIPPIMGIPIGGPSWGFMKPGPSRICA